jgi:hypothetical protein
MAALSAILSPLDQLMPRTYARVFLLFPVPAHGHEAAARSLRASLQQTLADLPYLQGSVTVAPESGNRLQAEWPHAGGGRDPATAADAAARLFRELQAPVGFPSLAALRRDRAPLHHFVAALSPVLVVPDHSADAPAPPPAFAASYTRLRGGLLLCACVHHALMDGTGVGELVRLWARNAAAVDAAGGPEEHWRRPAANEPTLRGNYLRIGCKPVEGVAGMSYAELQWRHPEYKLRSDEPPASPAAPPDFSSKLFAFPIGKINAAKEELRRLPGLESLTAFNILSAVLWSSITRVRARRLQTLLSHRVKLGFAVNGRKHLGDCFNVPPYLGNVNMFGMASLSVSDLFAAARCTADGSDEESLEPLIPVIASISGAIARISATHIAEVALFVDKTPDVTDINPGWESKDALDLSMTSWADMPLYNCDFGNDVGRPEFVRVPFAKFDGLVTILPRRRVDGDEEMIDVVLFLRADDIRALEKYEPWKWWTS